MSDKTRQSATMVLRDQMVESDEPAKVPYGELDQGAMYAVEMYGSAAHIFTKRGDGDDKEVVTGPLGLLFSLPARSTRSASFSRMVYPLDGDLETGLKYRYEQVPKVFKFRDLLPGSIFRKPNTRLYFLKKGGGWAYRLAAPFFTPCKDWPHLESNVIPQDVSIVGDQAEE